MKTMFQSRIMQDLWSLVTTFARGFDATERVLGRAMVLSARLGGDVSGALGGVCWSGNWTLELMKAMKDHISFPFCCLACI